MLALGFSEGAILSDYFRSRLQHAEVDYVLLERRGEFAPQVGASIGIFSTGARVRSAAGRSGANCHGDLTADMLADPRPARRVGQSHDDLRMCPPGLSRARYIATRLTCNLDLSALELQPGQPGAPDHAAAEREHDRASEVRREHSANQPLQCVHADH
jgi:hypothetical protein